METINFAKHNITTFPMLITIHDKLASIVTQIDQTGWTETQRLTVLKKWLGEEGRAVAFALWMIDRITDQDSLSSDAARVLLTAARSMLKTIHENKSLNHPAINALHTRLRAFHSNYRRISYGSVRIIDDWSVLLLEMALEICRSPGDQSAAGYQLAARYCEHYDARYGKALNGPFRERVQPIADFVKQREALEAAGAN